MTGIVPTSVSQRANIDFSELRQTEFKRLDKLQQVYLDYTGAALYPETLVDEHAQWLKSTLLGNPHSNNPTALTSSDHLHLAKQQVLRYFNASSDDYTVVFTANATAAIKLVAESFPFQQGSNLLLLKDNHNSINGIREYAWSKQANIQYAPISDGLEIEATALLSSLQTLAAKPSLFAYPAQSNFSGIQHELKWVSIAQQYGYKVLLDAAAFVASSPLDLCKTPADFVCISFYKMFGYPTGIGALIVRRDALTLLERPWFSGGTVEFASTQHPIHQLFDGEFAFEDGTANFASARAVLNGLGFMQSLGIQGIQSHCKRLSDTMIPAIQDLKHRNGRSLLKFYGNQAASYGSTRAFNVVHHNGEVIPYDIIEAEAKAAGISLRGGCFCNPGCAESAFGFSEELAGNCLRQLQGGQFSNRQFSECLGNSPVGALRVSWGMANTEVDITRLVSFLSKFLQ